MCLHYWWWSKDHGQMTGWNLPSQSPVYEGLNFSLIIKIHRRTMHSNETIFIIIWPQNNRLSTFCGEFSFLGELILDVKYLSRNTHYPNKFNLISIWEKLYECKQCKSEKYTASLYRSKNMFHFTKMLKRLL